MSYDYWIWLADIAFWYFSVPMIAVIAVLELWLTKQRAARYKATLHEIADGKFDTEYNDVRAQRDKHVKLARETLYDHW